MTAPTRASEAPRTTPMPKRPDSPPDASPPPSDAGARARLRRARTALLALVQIGLITTIFLQVNYLSCRRPHAVDLTLNQRFTLSDTTRSALLGIGGEVRVVMAFLASSELYHEVRGLLSEYDRVGGDAVQAEYLDLSRSRSRLAELEDRHQIRFGGDQVVVIGDTGRIKVLRAEDLVRRDANTGRIADFLGEQAFTAALLEVTEQRQRKIYLVTGGRRVEELVPIAAHLQPLANAQNARLEGLSLEGLSEIPEDADVLFFAGNSNDLSEREYEIVRDFWEHRRGGVVIFLDPAARTPNLHRLLREHGVAPNPDRVLSVVSVGGMRPQRISDVPVYFMPGDGPSREFGALSTRLTGQTQSIQVLHEDDLLISENIRPQPLLVAGEGFWGETDYQAEEVVYNPGIDTGPPDLVFTAASVEKGMLGDASLAEGSSRLVVVGNADFISPDGNHSQVNLDFTMSALNWVMAREELMGISPRQPTAFTLNISAADFGLLQSILIFVMPGLALIAGGLVWFRRRA